MHKLLICLIVISCNPTYSTTSIDNNEKEIKKQIYSLRQLANKHSKEAQKLYFTETKFFHNDNFQGRLSIALDSVKFYERRIARLQVELENISGDEERMENYPIAKSKQEKSL